jgi:cob(I)alamin adenosyltransferase
LAPDVRALLTEIQHDLFDLGGELCIPGHVVVTAAQVRRLEQQLDRMNATLAPLQEFILPGGTPAAAAAHVARAVCRRAERRLVSLARAEAVGPHSVQYLNRLSDLLFVTARYLNHDQQVADVLWQPRRPPPPA